MNVLPVPEGVFSSVQLHLLETLSHADDVFAWPVNPLLFLFLRFLNVINWGLCFPSMGLERRQVLVCPHLHIHRTLWVFFFCLFLLVLFFFLFLLFPIFLARVLAVCFSWSRSLAPFASECI